jgi:transposase
MEANYPTDLTDEQWQAISRLIPPAKPGGRLVKTARGNVFMTW